MLLALKDKTLFVEKPKTIIWIYETRIYVVIKFKEPKQILQQH